MYSTRAPNASVLWTRSAIALAISLAWAGPAAHWANASIILRIEDVTTMPDSGGPLIGFLEASVELTDDINGNDLTSPPDIAGFSVFTSISGSGTTQSGADRANINFTPQTGFDDPNFAFAFPFSGVLAVANDLDSGTVALENLAGLFRIEYTIAPSASGPATISEYTGMPNLTFLTLAGGGQLFFDVIDTGEITLPIVEGGSSVPEPATGLMLLGVLSCLGRCRRRNPGVGTSPSRRWLVSSQVALVLIAISIVSPTVSAQSSRDAADVKQPSSLTLAYYYPWYIRGDWSRHGYVGTPKLGKYGTDDPAVAEQHIRWARQAGIDALVVSWWGADHLTSQHIKSGLLQAKNLGQIRLAIIYESLGRLDAVDGTADAVIDFSKPQVIERFIADLKLLKQTYFERPYYLKLRERPVVVLYVTRTFRNFKRAHIDEAEKAIDADLYFVADEPFFGRQQDPQTALNGIDANGKSVFDAYTTYNMFENRLVRPGESTWDYFQREALPIYQQWSRSTIFCPNVMPSYHDFRGNRPLGGGVEGFAAQLKAVEQLPRQNHEADVPRLTFVTSFNEWWEGTTIEPAEEYGTQYLDALRQATAAD